MQCSACGAAAFPDDAFCSRCGAALPPAWGEVTLRRRQHPKQFGDEWEFVALTDDGVVVGHSPPFSADPVVLTAALPPPAATDAWTAFAHLQRQLTADRWALRAVGTPWHRRRFGRGRPGTAPTSELRSSPAPAPPEG